MQNRNMSHRNVSQRDHDDQHATVVPESDSQRQVGEDTQWAAADPFATFVHADGRREEGPRNVRYDALVRGDTIGNFRIQRLLGRGSFGAVYLARDLTLDRLVAVKVVLPEGQRATAGEGRSLARLKHPNIVGVFGEAHDPNSGCSLLWMQFVDGCNLANLIGQLHADPADGQWTESDLMKALNPDRGFSQQKPTEANARRSTETICRIGRQLSEALSHAHRSGIAHRDIKPANILMQRDGTPLLADFNLADNDGDADRESVAGGTVAYMPPEQLEHFLGRRDSYDVRRADIYSLGVVLWELMHGSRPYAGEESAVESSGGQRLLDYAQIRNQELSLHEEGPQIGLAMVLARAMSPEPDQRFPSAKALATSLAGLEELERARRRAPSVDRVRQFVRRHLVWVIAIVGLAPHFAASIFQSAYNFIFIKPDEDAFAKAFMIYNLVLYPACVGWLAWNLIRFAKGYQQVLLRKPFPRGRLRKLRGRLLRLPRQFMIASAVGWFPGIVLFPWLLARFGPDPSTMDWFHYAVSFAIAGLIATTYSYALVMFVAICHGYRSCWQTAAHYRDRARSELAGMDNRIRVISILVGVLPLAAAVLLLAIAMPSYTDQSHLQHATMAGVQADSAEAAVAEVGEMLEGLQGHMGQMRQLHGLLIALIVSGAIGLYVVQMASARLIDCVRALTLSNQ